MTTRIKFNHSKYPDKILNKSVSGILGANTLFSMASIKDSRESWINTAFYSFTENLEIFFLTYPTAVHSKSIEENPSVALAIFDSHQKPDDKKRGLQVFGECARTSGTDLVRAIATYGKRFPWLFKYVKKPEDFAKKVLESRFYVVHPKTIKIFDEKMFGAETWVTVNIK